MGPSGPKIGSWKDFHALKAYFRPLRARISPHFQFSELFLISEKNKEFDISHCVITCLFRKSKKFTPFLQYCQILQNWVTRLKEQTEKRNSVIFNFRMKSYPFLLVIISFLTPNFRFTRKINKFEKSRNFSMIFWLWSKISPDPFVRF